MSRPKRRPDPSPEAKEAIETARHARISSEAALPIAERMRDQVRSVVAANHFAELMEQTLREAARRRRMIAS
jgi:hypothetical protein